MEGQLRTVPGVLPMAILCRKLHIKRFFVAKGNEREALLVDGIEVYAVEELSQLIAFLEGREKLEPSVRIPPKMDNDVFVDDFADVQG